jgi:hypothetical protein
MQPIMQSSDSSVPSQSSLRSDWPPSLLRLVLGAVFAAGLSFVIMKTAYPIFHVPPEIAFVPETAPPEAQWNLEKAEFLVDGKNFSVFFAIIGAILAVSCVVFSFGARSVAGIVFAALISAALGTVGANLSNWLFTNLRLNSGNDLLIMGITLDGANQTIVGFGSLWCLIGLGVGIGVGAMNSVGKSLVAGIAGFCGGALAAMTYVVLTMQLSIGTTINRVFPADNMRLAIWLLLFQVAIAGCIALGLGERKRKDVA